MINNYHHTIYNYQNAYHYEKNITIFKRLQKYLAIILMHLKNTTQLFRNTSYFDTDYVFHHTQSLSS